MPLAVHRPSGLMAVGSPGPPQSAHFSVPSGCARATSGLRPSAGPERSRTRAEGLGMALPRTPLVSLGRDGGRGRERGSEGGAEKGGGRRRGSILPLSLLLFAISPVLTPLYLSQLKESLTLII